MPRRLHPGRPGSRMIPAGWAAAHQPIVETSMADAQVALREPGTTQEWSQAAEQNIAVPKAPYWTGGARIQALTARGQDRPVVASDTEDTADYLVTVPAHVAPAEGHLLAVTETDDPALAGRGLEVARVVRGSHRFERDLYCTLSD